MRLINPHEIELSSGRKISAPYGVLGISIDKESFDIRSGCDGTAFSEWSETDNQYTFAELQEIADYMVQRWQDFKNFVENLKQKGESDEIKS